MSKSNPRWLDRRTSAAGPYLMLVLSEEELVGAVRKRSRTARVEFPKRGARVFFMDNARGDVCAFVALSEEAKVRNSIEIAGLLVHEAVHVWQEFAERIGEGNPGAEQEAYAIQAIAQELMAEYARRLA